MPTTRLEFHYHLSDDAHSMDAVVRNRCEAETLGAFLRIAEQLGVSVQLESVAYREGGLREVWAFLGKSNNQLTLLVAIIVLIYSRFPPSDTEMAALDREVKRLTIEEKKLTIEKLKKELADPETPLPTISPEAAAQSLESDLKIATRRSNFYRNLVGYEKVIGVGFTQNPQSIPAQEDERYVPRHLFVRFVQATDHLPVEVIDGARIEIVSPVLEGGSYHWKGRYAGQVINFAMLDEDFKSAVLLGKVSFLHGSTIECVLYIRSKLDEVGEIKIVGYSVATVLAFIDGRGVQETPQGKRHRHTRKLASSQIPLDLPPARVDSFLPD